MDLSKTGRVQGFALAAKFFTRRSLNVEAVVRTFRPLWRTCGDFQASDAKHNHMVFTFEVEEDVEKVFMGEPWSFDRHLVVFTRYDGLGSVQELLFDKVSFWVQIHHLPFSHMTEETAISLGETIGPVIKTRDVSELRGGTFMRVRVSVNILEPICRGRRVTFGQNSKGWISFLYERLPNLCYWCGWFTHDDKECPTWLQSKGSLALEEQQFGAWLRAPQFNPSRRSYVEVKGFDMLNHHQRGRVVEKGPVDGGGRSLTPPVETSGKVGINPDAPEDTGFDSRIQRQEVFSGAIMGIMAMDQDSLNSNSKYPTGSVEVVNEEVFSTETTGFSIGDLEKNSDENLETKVVELLSTDTQQIKFDMGWVEKSPLKVGGPTKGRGKGKGKLIGPSIIPAQTLVDQDLLSCGPKRKGAQVFESPTEGKEKEKRLKRSEEVGNGLIFLGSAEAAEQFRRVQ